MKKEIILPIVSKIYGILITSLMLIAFTPKLFGSAAELGKIPEHLFKWYDNPTGFFFTYILGYVIIWWKPLWGSIIIIAGGLLFFISNPNNGMFLLIFIIPTFLVSILYIWNWYYTYKKQN
jgi:hypothetical protein